MPKKKIIVEEDMGFIEMKTMIEGYIAEKKGKILNDFTAELKEFYPLFDNLGKNLGNAMDYIFKQRILLIKSAPHNIVQQMNETRKIQMVVSKSNESIMNTYFTLFFSHLIDGGFVEVEVCDHNCDECHVHEKYGEECNCDSKNNDNSEKQLYI